MADETAPSTSRNIPLPIQREVRQRCGFGCVVCGLPFFEYDHLLGWANVHRHVAEEITLLCDQHHREKTAGLLSAQEVDAANYQPHNLRTGVSKPYDLHYSGAECEIVIGSNSFSAIDGGYGTILMPVSIDATPLLAFILGDGHLLLNLNLFDEYNQLVLQIKNNQLFFSIAPWDIQLVGRNLAVREAARKILVDMFFEPPSRIIIKRGRFLRNGVEVLVRGDRVVITNNSAVFSGIRAKNRLGGVLIGPHDKPVPALISMPQVPRYVHNSEFVEEWIAQEYEDTGQSA